PAGGTGVPGPATLPATRLDRIDVGCNHIRLDAVDIRVATMADRADKREQTPRLGRLAHAGKRQNGPGRTVGVLAAILTNARWIALDITRLLNGDVERRRKETQQFTLVIQQVLFERSHRLFGTFRIGNAGQHAPRLRDGIDLAFVAVLRAKRCAV